MALVKKARGTRSYGCAALEMVYVATGRIDAYVTPRLSPWDFGGGQIIVEEVGGKVTTFSGAPLSIVEKSSVLVAKPGCMKKCYRLYPSNKKSKRLYTGFLLFDVIAIYAFFFLLQNRIQL